MVDDPVVSIAENTALGAPLSPWTYSNPELFELEYDAFFRRRWQFVGHASELADAGDFKTALLGRDSVFVIRDKEGALHAFLNVCRHRASRILEGSGHCRGVIRCPYHGWTYRLDGSLMAIPREETFPGLNRDEFGLHEVELEELHGLLFVRLKPGGPALATQFGPSADYFGRYGVTDYIPCADDVVEIWNVNWKVAWDNYLENYHIPIGHPGLHRLLTENDEYDEYSSGVSYGTFEIREKPSRVDDEREYQSLFHHGCRRLPDELHGRWVQFGVNGNLGIDLYPELLDLFQLIPLSVDRTMVRAAYYGHRSPTPEEERLRELNLRINLLVNEEDRTLCERVQAGLATQGYTPGPLSQLEDSVFRFHQMVRRLVPVAALAEAPAVGTVGKENIRLSGGTPPNHA